MSIETPRKPGRGPEWDRKSYEIRVRDGGYRDAQGAFHGVCRNWLEARNQDMLESLPAGCRRSNGEDEVWACHSNSWSKYPALRLVGENSMALCRHCDPDRNPAMRPDWWGSSRHPVTAGWERRQSHPWELYGFGLLTLAVALVYAVLFAGWSWSWMLEASWAAFGAMPFLSTKHRHTWAVFDLGSALWLALLGLDALGRYQWRVGVGVSPLHTLLLAAAASYIGTLTFAHQALRRRWISRSLRAGAHLAARPVAVAWRKAKGARRLPRRTA